mgnify:CR=1 FL=1
MTNIIIIQKKEKNSADFFFNRKKFNCIIGFGGIGFKKREGDGITPKGIFKLNSFFYRKDKVSNLRSILKKKKIEPFMGWSSDSRDPNYNKLIKKPYRFFHENLYRSDECYDLILCLNYNTRFRLSHRGSAIFLHCKKNNQNFTDGCVAIKKEILVDLLKTISSSTQIIIK